MPKRKKSSLGRTSRKAKQVSTRRLKESSQKSIQIPETQNPMDFLSSQKSIQIPETQNPMDNHSLLSEDNR